MKLDSEQRMLVKQLKEPQIATLKDHPVMTEQFMEVYREMISLSNIGSELRFRNVIIYGNEYIHELYTDNNRNKPHMVCLHGFGATALAFQRLFQPLRNHFQIHALDLYGMGLSSRGNWNDDMKSEEVISYYVEAIQEWRKQTRLARFILVGHSFGGLIAAYYYEKYWKNGQIEQIIFLSPAGTTQWTQEQIREKADQGRSYFTCFGRLGFNMHIRPSKVVNLCCFGSIALKGLLNDKLKLSQNEQQVWKKYIKLVSDQQVVSEQGFYTLVKWPANADRNIQMIINQLKPSIPFTFIFGTEDWIRTNASVKLSERFANVTVEIIQKAGHHLIFDKPIEVAAMIIKVCLLK